MDFFRFSSHLTDVIINAVDQQVAYTLGRGRAHEIRPVFRRRFPALVLNCRQKNKDLRLQESKK